MIYTERTVRITNGVASIDSPILLYRGDRQVEILFKIIDNKFKFSSEKGNYIKNVEASFGQLAIDCPDGSDVFTEVSPCIDGAVTFTITGEMIDELYEVGFYSFHIRLFNNDQSSRITVPPIMKGIEIREPIVIEEDDYGKVAMVDHGQVDEAIIENEQATFLDENGNLNIEWKKGDIISSLRLNQMVGYINENAVPGEQGLKGEKGEQGEQGPEGKTPVKGIDYFTEEDIESLNIPSIDGLATETFVKSEIAKAQFESADGNVDLSAYATKKYVDNELNDIIEDYTGGKKQRYISQVEYDNLTQDELNDGTIVWNITDGEEVSIPADLTINSSNLLQLMDSNGNTIGKGVTVNHSTGESVYTLPKASNTVLGGIKVGERLSIDSNGVLSADIQQGIISDELILTSPSGYQFKLMVNDEGQLRTEAILIYGNITASVSELSITEGESTIFTISLSETPTKAQTISIVSDNTDVTVNPSSINISDTNPHAITVSVSEDGDNEYETATLTLSSDNVSNVTIKVLINEPKHCTGISLEQTSLALNVRNSQQLKATVTPEGCTDEIVWSTSNENCTVENGLVRAINEGDCVITATCGNYSATCNITVNALPTGANLFNASYLIDGINYDEETTEISNAARWAYFAYIPIEGGKKYQVSFSTNARILCHIVGSDKNTHYNNVCDTNSLVDGNKWFDVTSDVITAHVDASYIRMQLGTDAHYKAFIKDICIIEVE